MIDLSIYPLSLKEYEKFINIDLSDDTILHYDGVINFLDSKGYVIGIYSTLEKEGEIFTPCVRIKGNKRLTFINGDSIHSFIKRDYAMNSIVTYCLTLLEKELK